MFWGDMHLQTPVPQNKSFFSKILIRMHSDLFSTLFGDSVRPSVQSSKDLSAEESPVTFLVTVSSLALP